MPYTINKYRCSYCHKEFNKYSEAYDHELECHKCNTCANAYYVYGCEFDCNFLSDCGWPKYEKYKKKND